MDIYTVFIKNYPFSRDLQIEIKPSANGGFRPAPLAVERLKPLPHDIVKTTGSHRYAVMKRRHETAVVYIDPNGQAHLIYGFIPYPIYALRAKTDPDHTDGFWKATAPTLQDASSPAFGVMLAEPFNITEIIPREQAMACYYYKIQEDSPHADPSEISAYQTIYRDNLHPDNLIPPSSPQTLEPMNAKKRHDLRNHLIFTIDDETSKDMDDAVEVKKLKDGSYLLGVHIADVTAFIQQNSLRDKDAAERATSHYLADRFIHMLPECLSSDLCSLRPEEDRLAVSVYLIITTGANGPVVTSMTAARSVIRSRRKLSYDQVQHALEKFDAALGRDINHSIHTASELADILASSGVSDADLRADKIFMTAHNVLKCRKLPFLKSRDIIKQFMVAANQAVGQKIADVLRGITPQKAVLGAYRIQTPPHPSNISFYIKVLQEEGFLRPYQNFATFKDIARRCIESKPGWEALSKADYNAAIHSHACHLIQEEIASSKPDVKLKLNVLTKLGGNGYFLFRKAGISGNPDQSYHHSMRVHQYAWFTSPIRRYPDIVNHRQLLAAISGTPGDVSGIHIEQLAEKTHAAKKASQQMNQRLELYYRFQDPDFLNLKALNVRIAGFDWINASEFEMAVCDRYGLIKFLFPGNPNLQIHHNGLECRFNEFGKTVRVGEVIEVRFPDTLKKYRPESGRIVISPGSLRNFLPI